MTMENYTDYNSLSEEKQNEVCQEFSRIYPETSREKIQEALSEINPSVSFNQENIPEIWEAHRDRFEDLLSV